MGSIGTEPIWDPTSDLAVGAAATTKGLPLALGKLFDLIGEFLRNQVNSGAVVGDPTTPSTQATGATGATVVNVNISAIDATVNGIRYAAAAAADTALHDTTVYTADVDATTLTSGKSAVITVCLAEDGAGTVSLETVKGSTATTGAQVAPTQAQITTKIGHARWIKLYEVTINRTGNTTITQSAVDKRPALGENYAVEFYA